MYYESTDIANLVSQGELPEAWYLKNGLAAPPVRSKSPKKKFLTDSD